MRVKDTFDVLASCVAIAADALAVFVGFLLATWVRFNSGWIPLFHDRYPERLYTMYAGGAAVTALVVLFTFQTLKLYVRPQLGSFADRIPRLVRGILTALLIAGSLTFILRTEPPFARLVAAIAVPVIMLTVLLERWLLFRWEIRLARRRRAVNHVLIIGADFLAERLRKALMREPRLCSEVIACLQVGDTPVHPKIPLDLVKGTFKEIRVFLETQKVDQAILTDTNINQAQMLELILLCEQNMVDLNIVPDLFRIMPNRVDLQTIDEIPLLGVIRWPLDLFWNRLLKRLEDIAGALLGLLLTAPLFLIVAWLVRRDSPGGVFYRQERCGEQGQTFYLYKFRTMRPDAESKSGPVWAVEDDPRRTRVGAWLRRTNLDELPQLWNVLKGDMSLVGPRPERPCFVLQFKEDINRYMWRHASKPGITGWAQVNGLRGNTDIRDRVKYDLYYLENWSLAFDFKIILKTFTSHENAY